MIHCKNCIHWADESLEQIEADHGGHPHIFMGCRIFGFIENHQNLPECNYYVASQNLFTICSSCKIVVPKVCVSLAECVNCTDTDLFCIDSCMGGESRKYCTHFVRLHWGCPARKKLLPPLLRTKNPSQKPRSELNAEAWRNLPLSANQQNCADGSPDPSEAVRTRVRTGLQTRPPFCFPAPDGLWRTVRTQWVVCFSAFGICSKKLCCGRGAPCYSTRPKREKGQ